MQSEPFSTERLVMRAMRIADADALHAGYSDEALMTYWSSAPKTTLAETIDYLMPRLDHPDGRGWAITVKGDDCAIGTLFTTQRRPGVSEIGYMLVRSAWGRGYAREAVAGSIDLLFGEGMRRVFADTDPDNAASIALLERLGFRREGVLRGEWETHIGVRDSLILGLLKDEWASSSVSTHA